MNDVLRTDDFMYKDVRDGTGNMNNAKMDEAYIR